MELPCLNFLFIFVHMGKKDEILDAARSLFNRYGFYKTSVDDIAQAVGMQKSSLYYYFKDKEELFISAYIREWDNVMDDLVKSAEKESGPDEKILKYVRKSLKHYERVVLEHNIPMKVIVETRNTFKNIFNQTNHKSLDFIENTIQEGIDQGYYRPVDPHRVAVAILNAKYSIQYDNFMQYINSMPTPGNFKRIREEVIFIIELMLKGLK